MHGFELSVFIHVKSETTKNPLTRQAYFLGANQGTTIEHFYRIVQKNIEATPALFDELAGKRWELFDNNRRLARKDKRTLGSLPRPSFTSLDLNLVFYHPRH